MQKKLFLLLLYANLAAPFLHASSLNANENKEDSSKIRFTFIPDTHIIPLFTADQRAHRLSVYSHIGTSEFIGSMGGIFPVAQLSRKNKSMQFSVASSLYTTLLRSGKGGTLINADFFVDLFFDLKLNEKFQFRFSSGHTSQHLSDDGSNLYTPINYVRDYFQLFSIYQITAQHAFVYGGIILNHNLKTTDGTQAFDMSGKPSFQMGFEHVPFKISKQGSLFWGGDIKFRAENDLGTTQNIQAGIKFKNAHERVIRIAGNYSSGYDERGQFYTQQVNFVHLGFTFEF